MPGGIFFGCKGLHKKRFPQSLFVGIFSAAAGAAGSSRQAGKRALHLNK
jgi:hypothetical protein